MSAVTPLSDSKVQCFKCKGFGHYTLECPTTCDGYWENGSVHSEDEDDGVERAGLEESVNPLMIYSSGDEENEELDA